MNLNGQIKNISAGDHWYPERAVAEGDSSPVQLPLNYEDMLKRQPDLFNHIKFDRKQGKYILVSTCQPRHGHVKPLPITINMSGSKDILGKL